MQVDGFLIAIQGFELNHQRLLTIFLRILLVGFTWYSIALPIALLANLSFVVVESGVSETCPCHLDAHSDKHSFRLP